MDLQAGLETTDRGAPLHSEEAVLLSETVAAERHEGRLLFYNASGPIFSCPEADGERVRLGAAILLSHEVDVRVDRLAEFLEMSRTTLWRWRKRYEQEGVEGVRYNYEGRPPHKHVGERRERAQRLLNQGGEQHPGGRGGGGDRGGDPAGAPDRSAGASLLVPGLGGDRRRLEPAGARRTGRAGAGWPSVAAGSGRRRRPASWRRRRRASSGPTAWPGAACWWRFRC